MERSRDRWFRVLVGSVSRLCVARDRCLRLVEPRKAEPGRTSLGLPSGSNLLDAALVLPPNPVCAVLICHGIGETPVHWVAAQRILAGQGIASLVFNYSGFGRSRGRISPQQCELDTVAAYGWLRGQLPGVPLSLLGFSLGTGVAAAVAGTLPVRSLILCEGYPSFREAAGRMGLPGPLRTLLPDVWRTEDRLGACPVPVLIVHGTDDRLFPLAMGERLAHSCGARLAAVPGMTHSDLHARADAAQWQVIVDWLLNIDA